MAGDESNASITGWRRAITTEIFLGSLVAILTIFTAVAAYQGSRTSTEGGRASGRSVRTMLESNAEYLRATQSIAADQTLYGLYLTPDREAGELDYYEASFSTHLQEALDRVVDDPGLALYPFDEQYETAQYEDSQFLYDQVFELVDESARRRVQTQRFQLATFVFAIALAFSSWASLAVDGTRLKIGFSLLSTIIGALGVATYVFALSSL
ncbi:MAG: hypothetical protein ACRBK7_21780 [Acidimicrobiales bacterium]